MRRPDQSTIEPMIVTVIECLADATAIGLFIAAVAVWAGIASGTI